MPEETADAPVSDAPPPTPEELTRLYVRFAEALLPKLDAWSAEDVASLGTKDRLYFLEPSGTSTWPEVRGGHRAVLRNHSEEVHGMVEYRACADAHIAAGKLLAPQLSKLNGSEEEAQRDPYRLQFPFLQMIEPIVDLRDRYRTDLPARPRQVTRDEIIYSYHHGQDTWSGQNARWELSALLLNFKTSLTAPVDFGESVLLHPLQPPAKNALWQQASNHGLAGDIGTPGLFDSHSLWGSRARLAGFVDTDPDSSEIPNTDAINSRIETLVTALRLLKRGFFGTSNVIASTNFRFRDGRAYSFWSNQTSLDSYSLVGQFRPFYTFDAPDVPQLKVVLDRFGAATVEDYKELSVGLSRFNLSYNRSSPEDRIIDLTVALENLLLWGIDQELQYRLALRGAALLSQVRPPRETKAALEALYSVRSKIVHEGRVLSDFTSEKSLRKLFQKSLPGQQPEILPELAEDLTRSVLNAYFIRLSQGQSLQSIRADIDDAIIAGLIPATLYAVPKTETSWSLGMPNK